MLEQVGAVKDPCFLPDLHLVGFGVLAIPILHLVV